jgi:hypothetical protein
VLRLLLNPPSEESGAPSLSEESAAPQAGASGATSIAFDSLFTNPSALRSWHEHVFNRKTLYAIERGPQGEYALHAKSADSYSSLFRIVNIATSKKPILSWQWNAVTFPTGKKRQSIGADGENDFALRVCAIFAKNNPFDMEVIQYAWDDYFPEGTWGYDPYSKNVRVVVAHSGPVPAGTWVTEERDIAADYEKFFGKKPKNYLRGIAIMSNSDDTHSSTEAYLRRLWIERSSVAAQKTPAAKKELLENRLKTVVAHAREAMKKFTLKLPPLQKNPPPQTPTAGPSNVDIPQ